MQIRTYPCSIFVFQCSRSDNIQILEFALCFTVESVKIVLSHIQPGFFLERKILNIGFDLSFFYTNTKEVASFSLFEKTNIERTIVQQR